MGTLGTDSRRYTFESDLDDVIVDLGLRLEDIEKMELRVCTAILIQLHLEDSGAP